MLTTGFNLCQGFYTLICSEIAKLSAGSQDIPTAAFSDEDVDPGSFDDRLEGQHVAIRRTLKLAAGKRIEGDQVDLTGDAVEELHEPVGIRFAVVHLGQENIFKRQSSMGRQGIAATSGQESLEGCKTIDGWHEGRPLLICRGIQGNGKIDAQRRNVLKSRSHARRGDSNSSR